MTDKKLSIEVESKQTGSGLRDTAADVKKLEQQFDKAQQSANEFQEELRGVSKEADKVEDSQKTLTQAIFEAELAFEKAQSKSIALKSEWKRLAKSGEATREELRELSNQITIAEEREQEAINTTRNLLAQYALLKGETGDVAKEHEELALKLGRAEGYITGIDNKARLLDKNMKHLAGSVDDVGDEVQEVGQKVDRATGEIRRLGDVAEDSGRNLERLVKNGPHMVAFGNILADVFQDAARSAVNFAQESHQAFLDYDRGAREIFTLLPQASGEMRAALTRDARVLGTELGRLPDEMNEAIYMALSLGIPQDNVLEAIRLSSEAARAGVSELTTTLTTGQSIVNAYGDEIIDLERVYDLLFFTVKNGAVTIPELNGVMSEITSVAGEVGVGLEEISAALIVMTKQGDSASEAAGLLSNVLTQLSISGTALGSTFQDAAGIGFKEFIAQGGNLAQAMQILQEHADATGQSLGEMVGGDSPFFRDQQAMRGTLELTGRHLEELVKWTNEAMASQGMMGQAALEMGEAAETGSLRAKAALEELKIAVGEAADPFLTKLYENSVQFLTLWSGSKAAGVESMVDNMLAGNESAEDWADSAAKLDRSLANAAEGAKALLVDSATKNALAEGLDLAYKNAAATAGSFEDFVQNLEKAGLELNDLYAYMANSGDLSMISMSAEEFYELASAEAELARQAEVAAAADEKFGEMLGTTNEAVETRAVTTEAYVEAGEAYAVTAEQVAAAEQRRAAIQQELMGYYRDSSEPVNNLIEAQERLAAASGESAAAQESARQDVVAANEAIAQSYRTMAYEALLAQTGVTESTLALGVELGIMTQEAADQRLEFVQTAEAIARLTEHQDFLALSAQQQATAVDLVAGGFVTTTTEAINLASAYQTHLEPELIVAAEKAEELYDPLHKIGTEDFSTEVEVDTAGALQDVRSLRSEIDGLHDRTITITMETKRVGGQSLEDFLNEPNATHATGTGGWRTVPAGFPDDSYLVGLTSGEMYNVVRPGESVPVSGPDSAAAAPVTNAPSLTIQVQVIGYPELLAEQIGTDTKNKVLEAADQLGFAL